MSYNVAICLPPVPKDERKAWKQLDGLIKEEGPVPPVFRKLISRLTARHPCICDLPDDKVDDGVWSDGPLRNNAGHKATVLGMVYSRVDEVLPFLIETAQALDLVVFDWATEQIHRGEGIKGLRLTVEGEAVIYGPTLEQVHAAIARMTPKGGPGFMILERSASEDFTQTAGGDGVYTAEWRKYAGDTFRHWVAGLRGSPSKKEIAIPTNAGQVTVKQNERLTAPDVKIILSAFADGTGRPRKFVWREITDRFS